MSLRMDAQGTAHILKWLNEQARGKAVYVIKLSGTDVGKFTLFKIDPTGANAKVVIAMSYQSEDFTDFVRSEVVHLWANEYVELTEKWLSGEGPEPPKATDFIDERMQTLMASMYEKLLGMF